MNRRFVVLVVVVMQRQIAVVYQPVAEDHDKHLVAVNVLFFGKGVNTGFELRRTFISPPQAAALFWAAIFSTRSGAASIV